MTIDEFKEKVELNNKCEYWFIDNEEIEVISELLSEYYKLKSGFMACVEEKVELCAELDSKDKEIAELKETLKELGFAYLI
jgi:predicted nuclease with TOPRIM domain